MIFVHIALTNDPSLVPSTQIRGLQLLLTLAPGNLTPYSGLCEHHAHMHKPPLTHLCAHTQIFKKMKINYFKF